MEGVSDKLPRHSIKIFLGDFIVKIVQETIYRLTIRKDSLNENSDDNGT